MWPPDDVFTVDEIARAAGVPRLSIQRLIESGYLRPIGRTGFFTGGDALRAGRQARLDTAAGYAPVPTPLELLLPRTGPGAREDSRLPAIGSSLVHVALFTILVWSTTGASGTATSAPLPPQARLVFWAGPGPGGGGGGHGQAPKTPVRRIAAPRPRPSQTSVREPEPLPARMIISPVATTAGDAQPLAVEQAGQGAGEGPGLDEGFGGGTGGGPFRPGSGIDPPRLLQEVKARYTDAARENGVTGSVILEIVVRSDGGVGDIHVIRGLGFGLDDRAVTAVRSWRFAPALRRGQPVDVIVEVEVDFALR